MGKGPLPAHKEARSIFLLFLTDEEVDLAILALSITTVQLEVELVAVGLVYAVHEHENSETWGDIASGLDMDLERLLGVGDSDVSLYYTVVILDAVLLECRVVAELNAAVDLLQCWHVGGVTTEAVRRWWIAGEGEGEGR